MIGWNRFVYQLIKVAHVQKDITHLEFHLDSSTKRHLYSLGHLRKRIEREGNSFLNYARKIWWSLLYSFSLGGMARWDHGTSEMSTEWSPHWWNPMSNSMDMQLSGLFLRSSLTSVGSSPYFHIATFLRGAQIWVIKWPPCLLPQWSQTTSENVWQDSSTDLLTPG